MQRMQGLDSLKFKREEVLAKVRQNFKAHTKQYEQAKEDFVVAFKGRVSEFKEEIEEFNKKTQEIDTFQSFIEVSDSFPRFHDVAPPMFYGEEFERAIEMLAMATDEELVLDQVLFRQLVQNEWEWSRSFEHSNVALAQAARAYKKR